MREEALSQAIISLKGFDSASGTRYFTTQCDEALAEQRPTLFCETHSEVTGNVTCPQ